MESDIILKEVDDLEAMQHALWEAHVCIGEWAFCASLAMMRKALDIWSARYRDEHGMMFEKGEKDELFWRLKKIAEANPAYRAALHDVMDGLRLDTKQAIHRSTICPGGFFGTLDGAAITAIRDPYMNLHRRVIDLIAATTPGWSALYSDQSKWKSQPRGFS